MRKAVTCILFLLTLIAVAPTVRAQSKSKFYFAGGYVYQPKDVLHGGWAEVGFDIYKRVELFTSYTRFNDRTKLQDIAPGLRLRLYDHVWVEGAYGLGRYAHADERTYIVGLGLETPRWKNHFAGVARFDYASMKLGGLGRFERFRPYVGVKVFF